MKSSKYKIKTNTKITTKIPEIIPEKRGEKEESAMPKQSGTATKKTTILAGKSLLNSLKRFFDSI